MELWNYCCSLVQGGTGLLNPALVLKLEQRKLFNAGVPLGSAALIAGKGEIRKRLQL